MVNVCKEINLFNLLVTALNRSCNKTASLIGKLLYSVSKYFSKSLFVSFIINEHRHILPVRSR